MGDLSFSKTEMEDKWIGKWKQKEGCGKGLGGEEEGEVAARM